MSRRGVGAVLGACAVAWLAGCRGEAAPASGAAEATPREAVVVESVTIDVPLVLPSQAYVEHDVVVHARSAGVVDSIAADVGTAVREGQLLVQLEHIDQDLALEQARESADAAAREVRRLHELSGRNVFTASDSERIETEGRRAAIALRQAQRAFDLTHVVAPFAGVVVRRMVQPYRFVAEGDSLLRLSALAPLLAAVHVSESAARGIAVGTRAWVAAIGGGTTAARVVRAAPALDAASGTREFVLELADGARIPPGAGVTVRLGAERRRAVVVPEAFLTPGGQVMVDEQGRAVARSVVLGARLADGRVEVTSGLAVGERVLRP